MTWTANSGIPSRSKRWATRLCGSSSSRSFQSRLEKEGVESFSAGLPRSPVHADNAYIHPYMHRQAAGALDRGRRARSWVLLHDMRLPGEVCLFNSLHIPKLLRTSTLRKVQRPRAELESLSLDQRNNASAPKPGNPEHAA